MELFRRHIDSRVLLKDTDIMQVEIKLDDSFHEIELILEIRHNTRTITGARGRFIRSPYDRCSDTITLLESLVGVTIAPGVRRVISRRVGGPEGCTHLYELVMEAMRSIMQGNYGTQWQELPEGERPTQAHQDLTGECYIYSHPEMEIKFLMDSSSKPGAE